MARFNEILEGRYNRFLQKLLSMKGPPVTPQLASEIQPVLGFFHGAENRQLEGWDRFATVLVAPQVAGQTSGVVLRNPAGSGVVAVVEKIVGASDTAADYMILQNGLTADLPTTVKGVSLDFRTKRGSSLTASANTTGSVGAGSTIERVFGNQHQSIDLILTDNQEITITPGDGIQLKVANVNEAIIVTYVWRERLMAESEVF